MFDGHGQGAPGKPPRAGGHRRTRDTRGTGGRSAAGCGMRATAPVILAGRLNRG
jgi:hypothetical protein